MKLVANDVIFILCNLNNVDLILCNLGRNVPKVVIIYHCIIL